MGGDVEPDIRTNVVLEGEPDVRANIVPEVGRMGGGVGRMIFAPTSKTLGGR